MNKTLRTVTISLAFVFSIAVAALAGSLLAMWDTGNIETAKTIVAEKKAANDASFEEKTQQVIKKEGSIKDAVDGIIEKGVQVSGFDSIFIPDSTDADADKLKSDKDELDDVPADVDEDEPDDEEEDEPIEITAEISSVPEIVRASAMDTVILNTNSAYLNEPPVISTGNLTLDPIESYPLPFTKVDESYFADALFIGDSRMQGFGMYSKVNSTFYAQTAFQLYKYKTFKVVKTPEGKVPIFDAMPYDAFTKIYIKVGLNEMGMSDEAFINVYTQFINDLRAMQPRAIIYIHAILPVTASKSNSHKVHNNTNIARRNAVLKNFAEVMKCYYVDVGPYVSDETGALIADSAADGVHMSGKYMHKWVEGLCDQAVLWPQ